MRPSQTFLQTLMGAWGTGIFSDDLAADVRGDWREGILDRRDPDELARDLSRKYASSSAEAEASVVFWLALSAAQSETGRLLPWVRDRALEIIETGGDIDRWRRESEKLARERQAALARLADTLSGPQPAPKRLRRTAAAGVAFATGDAIRLRSTSGVRQVFAVVVATQRTQSGDGLDPIIELISWDAAGSPTLEQLANTRGVPIERPSGRVRPHVLVVTTPRRKDRFGPDIGELVARDVGRRAPGDLSTSTGLRGEVLTSWTTWPGLAALVSGAAFAHDLALLSDR